MAGQALTIVIQILQLKWKIQDLTVLFFKFS